MNQLTSDWPKCSRKNLKVFTQQLHVFVFGRAVGRIICTTLLSDLSAKDPYYQIQACLTTLRDAAARKYLLSLSSGHKVGVKFTKVASILSFFIVN